jgi:CheY-like chemotaxis protein
MSEPVASPRVLVVEAQYDVREALRMVLALCGYHVVAAEDGDQGLRLAVSWWPDVVISGIRMPGLDGWQLARRLRDAIGAAPLLVALSGYCEPRHLARSRAAGFDAHLVKPAVPGELLALLPPPRTRRNRDEKNRPLGLDRDVGVPEDGPAVALTSS